MILLNLKLKSRIFVLNILREKAKAKSILASNNVTTQQKKEAGEILAFDPMSEVYKLQNMTDEELKAFGMDEARIHIIRNFKGTEKELLALGATCSVGGNPKYTKNASGQWAKITFAFSWDKKPIWQKRDALVAQATTGFLVDRVPDIKCNINYADGIGNYYYKYLDADDLISAPFANNSTSGFGFAVMEKHVAGLLETMCFAESGMATIVFRSRDTNQVMLSYGYAHAKKDVSAQLGISFSLSNLSGNLGFAISKEYYDMLPEPVGGCVCDSKFFS